jgi:hypothetical protein
MSDDMREGREMSDAHENKTEEKRSAADLSRRRFAKAGLLGAPFILTLNSRPALGAYQCTVSGMMSGNLSNIDQTVDQCYSKSEGVWTGTKVLGCHYPSHDGTYPDHCWPSPYYPTLPFHSDLNPDSPFDRTVYDYGDATMIEVMYSSASINKGGLNISGDDNVGFKAAGALLNAQLFGETYFGYSADWVINTWNTWSGSRADLADFFSALNHRWDDSTPNPAHYP